MNFRFTKEEESFRQEVRGFLEKELPPGWTKRILCPIMDMHEIDDVWEVNKVLAPKLGEKGWLSLTWPKEYGGSEASPILDLIFQEELFYYGAPGRDPYGVGMVGPTLIRFATEEQKRIHLEPIAKGKLFWCEGYSEPEAGSDLASLQTRATEDGDSFVINGQKVWTSGGHRADWCFLLARTDPEAPKHRGISCFMVDMKTPGVEVRPLINIIGAHGFNEIYFDDVRVPNENLVGEKNQGWRIAMALLDFERAWIEPAAVGRHLLEEVIEYTKEGTEFEMNPPLRHRLAEAAIEIEIARLFAYRSAWLHSKGITPSYEAAESKVFGSELFQRVANIAMQLLGFYGQIEEGSKWAPLMGKIQQLYLAALGFTIAAGTSEVQRDVIAARGLYLPRR
ncbi:MAG: acyl-CoA dehydrogenase [Chloroflexi bacterium CG07_land_8_20_14_0_80_51_10]|nr:MAG: acyl-CoA dehydrogenase [Chloroflexi bacterium CG07_land_8_20_14_0_80_51_10]